MMPIIILSLQTRLVGRHSSRMWLDPSVSQQTFSAKTETFQSHPREMFWLFMIQELTANL